MTQRPPPTYTGHTAEQVALDYLKQQGLQLVQQNYRWHGGEIDLIMQEGDTRVFVEVRYRQSLSHGGALPTVDFRKQAKIVKAAKVYLHQHNLTDNIYCRFDVLGLEGELCHPRIEWIKDAFWDESQ